MSTEPDQSKPLLGGDGPVDARRFGLRTAALAVVAAVSHALTSSTVAVAAPYCCFLAEPAWGGCPSWCSQNGHNITGWTCYQSGTYYWCGECRDHGSESCHNATTYYCSWYSLA